MLNYFSVFPGDFLYSYIKELSLDNNSFMVIYNHNKKDSDLIDSCTYISNNFKCLKKADHILEMAGLGIFSNYRFMDYIC